MNSAEGWERRPGYLLSAVGAHVVIRFSDLLRPFGLQPSHFGVLRQLAVAEGATQQELADALRYRRAAMVGLLDELEDRGLVERRRHPHDRRANALHLTPAGRRIVTRISTAAAALEEELLAALDPATRTVFLDGLRALGVVAGVSDGIFPKTDDDPDEQAHGVTIDGDVPPPHQHSAASTGRAAPARRLRGTDRKA